MRNSKTHKAHKTHLEIVEAAATQAGRDAASTYLDIASHGRGTLTSLLAAHPTLTVEINEAFAWGQADQVAQRAAFGRDWGYDDDGNRV